MSYESLIHSLLKIIRLRKPFGNLPSQESEMLQEEQSRAQPPQTDYPDPTYENQVPNFTDEKPYQDQTHEEQPLVQHVPERTIPLPPSPLPERSNEEPPDIQYVPDIEQIFINHAVDDLTALPDAELEPLDMDSSLEDIVDEEFDDMDLEIFFDDPFFK